MIYPDSLLTDLFGREPRRAEVLELWQARRRPFLIFWSKTTHVLMAELKLVAKPGVALHYQGEALQAGEVTHYRVLDQTNSTLVEGVAAHAFNPGPFPALVQGDPVDVALNFSITH